MPKLYRSCFNDDFERYTARAALHGYTHGVDEAGVLRWIFLHVLSLGYETDQIVSFDQHILYKYGGGRSRPSWAERLGKKYQWIALYRILGHIKDHVQKSRYRWERQPSVQPLQGESLRNIDPSIVIRASAPESETSWWAPVRYDFKAVRWVTDAAWLDLRDFPNPHAAIEVTEPATGKRYYVLQAYLGWYDTPLKDRSESPYRHVFMHLRSCLVPKASAKSAWMWLNRNTFAGRAIAEGGDLHDGFLGEYPFGISFLDAFRDERRTRDSPLAAPMYPTVYTVSSQHGFDAFHAGMNVFVPSPRLLDRGSSRWNGVDGYDTRGRMMFDPSIRASGPKAFVIDAEYMSQLLHTRRLALIWTAVSEKQSITGMDANSLGYAEASHIARFHRGVVEVSPPLINRVR